ncbi:DNA ligase 3 [Habropoda laboriosa]|uniref:DNA ligase n=1 Tax=Habropoda laboriosa TaxID=597456 RepID=A0A0L7QVE8_9HYME|nr:DNA ligase 3 [Habropoda laboriosa]
MSDDEKEDEKPFAVEQAKTGRAKCKKCKCPIQKDTVRIAKLVANPFSDGKMKAWHHMSCLFEVFAKQRASSKKIDDPEKDISGWENLCDEDKRIILQRIDEFENTSPFKIPKTKAATNEFTTSSKKRKVTPAKQSQPTVNKKPKRLKKNKSTSSNDDDDIGDTDGSESKTDGNKREETEDDTFEEFQRLCNHVAKVNAYTDKTAIVKKMLTRGSKGDGFKSDVKLWCRMLLPGIDKRVYNLQSKQLVKLYSRILLQDEGEMLEHLEQGDIAETIRSTSILLPPFFFFIQVDQFLERLSFLTKEDEQIQHFHSIISRCTLDDLKMIIRLIKHDLRINAGPKHILAAVHENAYEAFQTSRDLNSVIDRCLKGSSKIGISPSISVGHSSDDKIALTLMTPVLPMLAEACKSVEMAMKKCPNGMLSEVKYDGERVQVHKRGSEFQYFSRSLKPVLPHKVNLFKDYIPKAFPDGDDLILDSEVLMIDTKTGQPLPFGSLGVHKKAEFKDANVCLFVFDCIYYNGEVLLHQPMIKRREILTERMIQIPNRIMLSEIQEVYDPKDLVQMIGKVFKMGLEGLVLKDVESKYEPGKRHWLKVKRDYIFGGKMADSADLVVLGAWYGTGNKGGMMSIFLMGCYDEDHGNWVTVTKVNSRHDDVTLAMLQDELDMVKIGKDPSKVPSWLRVNKPMIPDFVARDPKKQPVWEITGAEFTNHGIHTADGISIRFPRVTRIRHDKDVMFANTLNELRHLFEQSFKSIDLSLLLPSNSTEQVKEVGDKKVVKSPRCQLKRSSDLKVSKTLSSNKSRSRKIESIADYVESNSDKTIKKEICNAERKDVLDKEDEERAEFYAFVNKHYIEYSAAGTPLNWIEDRKPAEGLPSSAKSLSGLTDEELKSKSILKGALVILAASFKKRKRKHVGQLLKTLGGKALKNQERSLAMYVVHPSKELPSSELHLFDDIPKTARHVSLSWLEASASNSEIQQVEVHAVELTGDYCSCPCPHR